MHAEFVAATPKQSSQVCALLLRALLAVQTALQGTNASHSPVGSLSLQLLSRLESAVQEAEFAKRETDRERERNAATRASILVHDGLDANCELTPEEASLERVKEEPVSPLSTASHHCARDAGSRKRLVFFDAMLPPGTVF